MLTEFYKAQNFPDKERIRLEKNILFIMPDKDYDLKPVLKRLGLSKWEVAVTWPKQGLDMLSEVMAAKPKLVIQVGTAITRKFHFLPDDGSKDAELKAKAEAVISDTFIGLHHHDEFSIKDALGTVDQLIKMLTVQRRSFCCVTNHGSVGGWIKQYNACKKNGVKAIFGMEAYVSTYRGDDPEERKKHRSANHLVLLAKTMEGFDNIIKIHNDAQINGFYYTPRANHEAFKQWGKGIIASTACMAGEFPQLLIAGEKDKAKALYEYYKGCFDEVYIEIQIIEYEAQREANRKLIEFAKEVGAPLILTFDSHYLEPEHADTHDVLMCIRQHKTLFDDKGEENDDVWNFDVKNMYYRTVEQMRQVFEHGFVDKAGNAYAPFKDDIFTEEVFQEAIANTRKIAVSTEDIKLDSAIRLPKLYDDGIKQLRKKTNVGFKRRLLDRKPNVQEYLDRVIREFDVISKLGWADYFLVMEKIIADTIDKHGEWAIGYGRGSAAGSLISYCLGLTDVDPLKYGLLFERFISTDRGNITACNFDL
jgi:DNA polymerase-3 subunit alpha